MIFRLSVGILKSNKREGYRWDLRKHEKANQNMYKGDHLIQGIELTSKKTNYFWGTKVQFETAHPAKSDSALRMTLV